jgi:hypothetical protein
MKQILNFNALKITLPRILTALLLAPLTASAFDVTSELGRFGEITTWLIVRTPETKMEVDPFLPMGGESKYAAMGDPKLVPQGNQPLAIPTAKPGEMVRIGEGVWEGMRMVLPEMPGVWNELPRLVVPEGYTYAYCRLDSPRDMKGNLATGVNRGKQRLYNPHHPTPTGDSWAGGLEKENPFSKPLMDGMHELIVRPDGAGFTLWSPHYVANAIHLRRWNGQLTGYEPPPELKLEGGKLTWLVDGTLERRVLQTDGWSDWEPVKTTAHEFVEAPEVKAAAYRLRTSKSDWSATMYLRR